MPEYAGQSFLFNPNSSQDWHCLWLGHQSSSNKATSTSQLGQRRVTENWSTCLVVTTEWYSSEVLNATATRHIPKNTLHYTTSNIRPLNVWYQAKQTCTVNIFKWQDSYLVANKWEKVKRRSGDVLIIAGSRSLFWWRPNGTLFSRRGARLAVRLHLKTSPCANLSEVAKTSEKIQSVSPGLLLILPAVTFIFFGTNINTANPAEEKKVAMLLPHTPYSSFDRSRLCFKG